jgi:hypothetical protein
VYIKDAGSEPGKVRYALFIGDRRVTTSEKPTITSNCASIINTDIGADIVRIDYDFGNCYEEPGNHVRVAYRIYRKMVDKKFFFGADADNFKLDLLGDLGYDSKSGEVVLRLNSTYESPVLIELLEVSGQLGWNINERVDEQVKGKGVHTIRVFNSKDLDSNMVNDLVIGYLHYSSAESGAKKTLRIYRKNIIFSERE